jgi:hypothetical protein
MGDVVFLSILLILLALLFTSLFVIIPKYAPKDQVTIIQDWLGLGFSGLILLISIFSSRFTYESLSIKFVLFLIVLGISLSGIYWWIPTYIKKEDQTKAIQYMFNSITAAVILTNVMADSMYPLVPQSVVMTAGRRRK